MSRYYNMSVSELRDELDRLEELLWEYECDEPDDYSGRIRLQNTINNICNLIHRKELRGAA